MKTNTLHNPAELYPRYANYSHAVEVRGGARLLFISGLNGYMAAGKTMPLTFDEHCQLLDPKWKLELEAVAAG